MHFSVQNVAESFLNLGNPNAEIREQANQLLFKFPVEILIKMFSFYSHLQKPGGFPKNYWQTKTVIFSSLVLKLIYCVESLLNLLGSLLENQR